MINFDDSTILETINEVRDMCLDFESNGYQDDESPEENICDQIMRLNGSVRAVAFYLAKLINSQKGEDENGEDR